MSEEEQRWVGELHIPAASLWLVTASLNFSFLSYLTPTARPRAPIWGQRPTMYCLLIKKCQIPASLREKERKVILNCHQNFQGEICQQIFRDDIYEWQRKAAVCRRTGQLVMTTLSFSLPTKMKQFGSLELAVLTLWIRIHNPKRTNHPGFSLRVICEWLCKEMENISDVFVIIL